MKQKVLRHLSMFMLFTMLNELITPGIALALTSGPSQPEVQSFEPFSTSEMVNMSSGDFTYNIPLIDIEGYPINLSYSSGVTMDQEASWVGLGWNINPGVINRNMRGIPDDFNGDVIQKEYNTKSNTTYGVTVPISGELFGIDLADLGLSLGLKFNNYNGIGVEMSASPTLASTESAKGSMTLGLGISVGSETGVGINPELSFGKIMDVNDKNALGLNGKIGLAYNSRGGLSQLSFSGSVGSMKPNKAKNTNEGQNATDQKPGGDVQVDADGNSTPKENTSVYGKDYTPGPTFSGGSAITFAGQSYTPSISMPMFNLSLSTSFTGGFEIFGFHPNIRLSGYFSGQYLMNDGRSLPAYGYMNAQYGQGNNNAMMDFNREKDGSYSESTPALPLTCFTYDIFSVSGQGIGGMYRPFRSDWGYVFDSEVNSYTLDVPLPGIELGGGNAVRGGINISVNSSTSTSGKWSDDNPIADALTFKDYGAGGNLYEPYYFKQAGEKLVETDPDFIHQMGDFDPVRVEVVPSFISMPSMKFLRNEAQNQSIPLADNNNYRKKRAKRNEVVTTLSASEAGIAGLTKKIESYPDVGTVPASTAFALTSSGQFTPALIDRVAGARKAHHISEISTYRSDGTRYVYGIPAYNLFQKDVTFAVSGRQADEINGLVDYIPGDDNTSGNQNGIDNYFDRVTNPSYAHSYLLTAVLGANYVDLTEDGPTYDDLGGYTKINYSQASGGVYGWRAPFEKNRGSHNEGFKSLSISDEYNDDKASYIYGQKELWYIHSIESKNYIALFYTSYRKDGYGVKDENGGGDAAASGKMKQLDKIVLYSRQDLVKNGIANAVPIKTVNFVYDNSLCTGIANHIDNITSGNTNGGKLTLTEVNITYGNSQKGKLSSYTFDYSEVTVPGGAVKVFNPKYNMKGNDRWGNYKQTKGDVYSNCNMASALPLTSEFPYTDQDLFNQGSCDFNTMSKADVYASAWNLTTIHLPSGGDIHVDYEADDYAYVQNKRAMQMMKVVGAYDNTSAFSSSAFLTDPDRNKLFIGSTNRNYVVFDVTDFELTDPCSNPTDVQRKYFSEYDGTRMQYLYFKFLINVGTAGSGKYEFVPGYLKFDDVGLITSVPGKKYIYVNVDDVDSKYNRIAYTSWNFTRIHLPRVAYNQPDRNMTGVMQILTALASMGDAMLQTIEGFSDYMVSNNYSKEFNIDKSFARLECPNGHKKGGGCRVKKIRSLDNWADLTSVGSNEFNFDYGQEYEYTTINEYGKPVSSGVASYEPTLGGEENAFRQPVFYSEDKLLAPSDDFYQEEPYGESFFPSPSIVYSKVTVRSLKRSNAKTHGTGKVIHEFYTAKDFPTIPKRTSLYPVRIKPNPLFRLLSFIVEDYVTVSQGYSIELNDMHGKPKAQWVYAEQTNASGITNDAPISGIEYKYKQSARDHIDNNISVMGKDGKVTNAMVGVEIDQVADFREQKTVNRSGGFGGNLDAFLALIFPIAIPVVLPSYSSEEVRFRSAVVTKVINRYALQEETITYDHGARTSSKNIVIDSETGEVLITQSTNVFGDNIYNFTYPAHWIYDQMGQAYKNINYAKTKPNNGPMVLTGDNNLIEGDRVYVQSSYGTFTGWIHTIDNVKYVVDDAGNIIPTISLNYIKVYKSARKNQQSVPVGSIATLANPINWTSSTDGVLNVGDQIVDATAVEYSDDWKIFCECELAVSDAVTKKYNKLFRKRGGAWRIKTNWAYLTGRKQTLVNDNTNIRTDGVYENFDLFWLYNTTAGTWNKTSNLQQWQFKSTSSIFSPYGLELESKDPLDRYSAAQYGYANNLPIAISGNSQYREMGFDGFEDYDHMRCFDDHFSYKQQVSSSTGGDLVIDSKNSHSGKKSLKVKPTKKTTLTRLIQGNCNQ